MKKFICALLTFLLLCGCSRNSTKIDITEKTYEEDGYKIKMEIPKINGNSEFIKSFNNEYISFANNILDKFTDEAEKSEIKEDTLKLKQKVTLNKNSIISIVGDCEAYSGGPHGTLSRVVKNIDTKNECYLELKDLFTDDEYITRINSYIKTLYEKNPGSFSDLWKQPIVDKNQDFYLSDKGIVIYYPPYELSYYSKGFVEFEIPFKELEGYLDPEYIKRIHE